MIPIIIPAYEPDERLLELLKDLSESRLGPVIIVDDGSGEQYSDIFTEAENYLKTTGGVLLRHEVNRGKGRALKTAFAHVLDHEPDAIGCVTADSDGQHSPECIARIMEALEENPDKLVLGVRTFDMEGVPWKSRMGNKITDPGSGSSSRCRCCSRAQGNILSWKCRSGRSMTQRITTRHISIRGRILPKYTGSSSADS